MDPVTPLVVYVDGYEGNRVVFKARLKAQFNVACYEYADPVRRMLANGSVGMLVVDPEWPAYRELLFTARARFPEVPCAIITARNDVVREVKAVDVAIPAIIKPWNPREVVACLTNALKAPTPLPHPDSSTPRTPLPANGGARPR